VALTCLLPLQLCRLPLKLNRLMMMMMMMMMVMTMQICRRETYTSNDETSQCRRLKTQTMRNMHSVLKKVLHQTPNDNFVNS